MNSVNFKVIFLIVLIYSNSLIARSPKSLTPSESAAITLKEFKACHAEKSPKNSEKCVRNLTSSTISDHLNQKITFWLKNITITSKLLDCSKEKLRLFPYADENKYKIIKCIHFTDKLQSSGTAIIYFLDENGYMKIDGIQFY